MGGEKVFDVVKIFFLKKVKKEGTKMGQRLKNQIV
jgi:hypothetical protein